MKALHLYISSSLFTSITAFIITAPFLSRNSHVITRHVYDEDDIEREFSFDHDDDDDEFYNELENEFKSQKEQDGFQFIFNVADDAKPTKAHIVLFNPGTDREGVHTIEFPKGSGHNLILAFESRTECEQFSTLLKDQKFFEPCVSTLCNLFNPFRSETHLH